jgi:hypothetical protein
LACRCFAKSTGDLRNHVSRTLTEGIRHPQSIAIDGFGTLYVLNKFNGITEYAHGGLHVARKLEPHFKYAGLMAVAPNGTLYSGDVQSSIVLVYDRGAVSPRASIDLNIKPFDLLADPEGGLVAELHTYPYYAIERFAPGNFNGPTWEQGNVWGQGIAIGPRW